MEDIEIVHKNDIGIAFFWKGSFNKLQLVFKDLGLYLTYQDLKLFSKAVRETEKQYACKDCNNQACKAFLLRRPSDKIDIALTKTEFKQVKALIRGTLFKVELKLYLENSKN